MSNDMQEKNFISHNESYFETTDIKIASLLLAEVGDSTFRVISHPNRIKKKIVISFSPDKTMSVNKILADYMNKDARVNVYHYNVNLNRLRDEIKRDERIY